MAAARPQWPCHAAAVIASSIRDAVPEDQTAWRGLWAGYTAFYQVVVPEAVTAATWRRIIDPAAPIFARLAEHDGQVAGFAVAVLHEATWSTTPSCYLEDLFVADAARGAGLGRALIDDLVALAHARNWSRLYWHTAADNRRARRLYDGFAEADGFVRYRIIIAPGAT